MYREFIKNNYKELKGLNPKLPIYIRPADGVLPQISARYERGRYLTKGTAEMNAKQVEAVVAELEKMAGEVNASVSAGGFGGNTLKVATAGAK